LILFWINVWKEDLKINNLYVIAAIVTIVAASIPAINFLNKKLKKYSERKKSEKAGENILDSYKKEY